MVPTNNPSCLFELCKEDDIFSKQAVIGMGKFIYVSMEAWTAMTVHGQDLEKRGIRRTDKRLSTFLSLLKERLMQVSGWEDGRTSVVAKFGGRFPRLT